jgi:ribonuclease E
VSEEPQPESEKAVRRRSTVREKVSFSANAVPAATPAEPAEVEPPIVASADASAATPETTSEAPSPRKSGWWSRRFGGG